MVKKHSKKKGSSSNKEAYDNLYVCMTEANSKRKYLLSAIKSSLVMQEELERVLEFRKEKTVIAKKIKEKMVEMNNSYQKLKTLLPNVKNVIAYTEKELVELDGQIHMLRDEIRADKEKIFTDEVMQDSIADGELGKKAQLLKEERSDDRKLTRELDEDFPNSKVGNTRLDRIKNNLKVIEGKLKHI